MNRDISLYGQQYYFNDLALYTGNVQVFHCRKQEPINWLINNGVINMLITHFLCSITQMF